MPQSIDAQVLFTPSSEELRFLPEGPYRCPDGRISWVAIQHGANAHTGSLNILDLATDNNENFPLAGRPGFAFPTTRDGVFIIGQERTVGLFDTRTQAFDSILAGVDQQVDGTIINDGLVYDGHLIFGCKDLKFTDKKAGLYLLRAGESQPVLLSGEQICSNGKAISRAADGSLTLYDICSCSKQVLAWQLDIEQGTIRSPRVAVDLTAEPVFPDGMIMTADGSGLIVALYDPRESDHGQARLYDSQTGELKTIWRCAGSPRVTCPQLIERAGRIELLLTTADEGMSPELRAKSPHAGCLFIAPTELTALNDAPLYSID
ncbi:MAG: SMP-30/gluconolactonase/LRE family protein [Planctomycetales bacterium]|nr:SMP-30/gluconolactonase/LRE family protein [Planctomycetales bacterium]MCA9166210.1 SMP-30/gluconolactonase/LRE family protein [Planctomycetales bacterium]